MVYLFLANGFEEIEAIATLDICRRAGLKVTTVGVGGNEITGAHNISVLADITESEVIKNGCEGIILPGGMPGTKNLDNSDKVTEMLMFAAEKGLLIAAICAAPSVLGHKNLLNGKKATCFPGFEPELKGAEYVDAPAVCDGNIITGKGAGAVFEFAFMIVDKMLNSKISDEMRTVMQCPQ